MGISGKVRVRGGGERGGGVLILKDQHSLRGSNDTLSHLMLWRQGLGSVTSTGWVLYAAYADLTTPLIVY